MDRKWFVIVTKGFSPQMNMALDSLMWRKLKVHPETVFLRFYTWSPSAVSLGANQKPENIVDVEFCKKNNIPVVARITGGSAIFHDREITYSFSATNDQKIFPGPLTSYEKICGALKLGLEKLGVNVKWRGVSTGREPSLTNRDCFSLSSRHDLVVDGRKILGSAQRKDRVSFLQHGSLLLDIQKDLWENIFLQKPDFTKIVCLSEILSQVPDFDSIVRVLISGFEEFFQQTLQQSGFSAQDINEAKEIAEKFLLV